MFNSYLEDEFVLLRSVEETEVEPCDKLPTLVPYKQERNEVYSGVNTGEEEEERGGLL